MYVVPEELDELSPDELYDLLDDLTNYRKREGRGRSPEAQHTRDYCASERVRVKKELKRRGERLTRPTDTRTYGPGIADWQRAAAA